MIEVNNLCKDFKLSRQQRKELDTTATIGAQWRW